MLFSLLQQCHVYVKSCKCKPHSSTRATWMPFRREEFGYAAKYHSVDGYCFISRIIMHYRMGPCSVNVVTCQGCRENREREKKEGRRVPRITDVTSLCSVALLLLQSSASDCCWSSVKFPPLSLARAPLHSWSVSLSSMRPLALQHITHISYEWEHHWTSRFLASFFFFFLPVLFFLPAAVQALRCWSGEVYGRQWQGWVYGIHQVRQNFCLSNFHIITN